MNVSFCLLTQSVDLKYSTFTVLINIQKLSFNVNSMTVLLN